MIDDFNLPMSEVDAQKKISEISSNLREVAEILETELVDYLHQPYENLKSRSLDHPDIIIEDSKRLFWAQETLEKDRMFVIAGYMRLCGSATDAFKH